MAEETRRRRLPPLGAVRAFEAAGRRLSFTKAAEELHVTQAAVSHQIRQLEAWLGLPLFRRGNRSVELTEPGRDYLAAASLALDLLAQATGRLVEREAGGQLAVSVLPSFAARWLVPRLGDFRERHPEIDVRIAASSDLVDFARDDVDLAIRYGSGGWPGLRAVRFLEEEIFPVCSPRLLQGARPLRVPADLAQHVLLHDDSEEDWRRWLVAAGVAGVDATRGPVIDDSSMVLQAAVDGQGVALTRSALAALDLAAGRLVRPFDVSLRSRFAYWLVAPERAFERPKVKAFVDWVLEAVGGEPPGRTS